LNENNGARSKKEVNGYDNLMLVVEALRAGGTERESIRAFLENDIVDWTGTTGIFNFSTDDHNGLQADSMVMATVKDGKWTLLE
jgi:branched-chain amino acid transport system substrate-binding protein